MHALRDVWRVLVPSGVLIDFRPIGSAWPLEIVSGEERLPIAMVDRAPQIRDDATCVGATATAIHEGWFIEEKRELFAFSATWSNATEVGAPVTIPDEVRTEAQTLLDRAGPEARIDIRFENVIARYRRSG